MLAAETGSSRDALPSNSVPSAFSVYVPVQLIRALPALCVHVVDIDIYHDAYLPIKKRATIIHGSSWANVLWDGPGTWEVVSEKVELVAD